MKNIVYILGLLCSVAFAGGLITGTSAFGQEKPNQMVQLPIMIDCGPVEEVGKILQKYKELPTAKAMVTWRLPSGQYLSGPMTIWVNPETRTTSITIEPTEGFACVVMPGTDFGPFMQGSAT